MKWARSSQKSMRISSPDAACSVFLTPATKARRSLQRLYKRRLLMVAGNCLLPGLGFQHLTILRQLPRVLVIEILLIGSYQKMPAPDQSAALQGEDALRLPTNRAALRVGIVGIISQILIVILRPPGVFISILALPMHCGFLPCLIALDCPFARPRKTFILDIGSLFRTLGWRKCRWQCSMHGHPWQNQPRAFAPAKFQRCGH